jgi:hypothetical protein
VIRACNRRENRVDVVKKLRPLSHDVLPAPLRELNDSAIRISG